MLGDSSLPLRLCESRARGSPLLARKVPLQQQQDVYHWRLHVSR